MLGHFARFLHLPLFVERVTIEDDIFINNGLIFIIKKKAARYIKLIKLKNCKEI
jgi:hypothetical protein